MRALIAAIVVAPVVVWSVARLWRQRGTAAMQAVGALGLVVVVAAHICEEFHFLTGMGWGEPRSPGHFLDLSGAVVGVTLLPLGYLLSRRTGTSGAGPPESPS